MSRYGNYTAKEPEEMIKKIERPGKHRAQNCEPEGVQQWRLKKKWAKRKKRLARKARSKNKK